MEKMDETKEIIRYILGELIAQKSVRIRYDPEKKNIVLLISNGRGKERKRELSGSAIMFRDIVSGVMIEMKMLYFMYINEKYQQFLRDKKLEFDNITKDDVILDILKINGDVFQLREEYSPYDFKFLPMPEDINKIIKK